MERGEMMSNSDVTQAIHEIICEKAWEDLGEIPVDDDGNILERYGTWPVGTNREEIWKRFDEVYPGGVVRLMFGDKRKGESKNV